MPSRRVSRRLAVFAAGLALSLLAAPAEAVPLFFDEILTWHDSGLVGRALLPAGPALESFSVPALPTNLYVLPTSHLLATVQQSGPPWGQELYDVGADGTRRRVAVFETPAGYTGTQVLDMALDHRGRFFVAVYYEVPFLPDGRYELIEVDLATGEILSRRPTIATAGLATAPRGLWALRSTDHRVVALDPEVPGVAGPSLADISGVGPVSDLDSDSAGNLYFHRPCSPPCAELAVLDVATGLALAAPQGLYANAGQPFDGLAIRRRCSDTATSRCLQGGRFQAEVAWRDFSGTAGQARVAPARSRDTAVFSFFDAANWELMVKVLDGCDLNGNFWVYSSAATDVDFTLTVTDTRTEAVKTYFNPLGQVARSVTDSHAFPCAP